MKLKLEQPIGNVYHLNNFISREQQERSWLSIKERQSDTWATKYQLRKNALIAANNSS
jgi:hypothetical protein